MTMQTATILPKPQKSHREIKAKSLGLQELPWLAKLTACPAFPSSECLWH